MQAGFPAQHFRSPHETGSGRDGSRPEEAKSE